MKKGFLFAAEAAIRMKEKMLLFLIVLLLGGCDAEKRINAEPIGRQGDTIILSAKEHTFKDDGGDYTITTEGTQWIINGCDVDSVEYRGVGCTLEGDTFNLYGDITYYCDSFGQGAWADCEISKIEYSWFTITKETRQKIVFNVLPNETGKQRKIRLLLSDRNYLTSIEIDQLAE